MKYCQVAEMPQPMHHILHTSLFGTNPLKNHTIINVMIYRENNNNDVKMIIRCNIANHFAITISFILFII